MIAIQLNLHQNRINFSKLLKKEQKSYETTIYLYKHWGVNQTMVMDTKSEFYSSVDLYKRQGFEVTEVHEYEVTDIMEDVVKSARIHTFTNEGETVSDGSDFPSLAFDVQPGYSQHTIVEVTLLPKKKIKTSSEPMFVTTSHNVQGTTVNGNFQKMEKVKVTFQDGSEGVMKYKHALRDENVVEINKK